MVTRYSVLLRPNESLRPTAIAGNIAISPDGNRIAYVGAADGGTRLWLREHDKLRPLPIAGTENALSPFFSPDGSQVAYILNGRTLRVAPLNGGPPVTLTDSLNASGGDWGADGYIYTELQVGLGRIRATGGPIEVLFKLSDEKHEIGAEYPSPMPDGKGLVFRRRLAGQPANDFEIMEMAIPNGTPRPLIRRGLRPLCRLGSPAGGDGRRKAPGGPVRPGQARADRSGRGGHGRHASHRTVRGQLRACPHNGTLVYTAGGTAAVNSAWWVNRDGTAAPMDSTWDPQGNIGALALAPDGKSIAVTVARGAASDIWVKQLPRGPFSRITFGDTVHFRPTWAADGQVADLHERHGLRRGPAVDEPGRRHGHTASAAPLGMQFAQAFETRDGRWLVLRRSFAETGAGDIYAVRTGDTTWSPCSRRRPPRWARRSRPTAAGWRTCRTSRASPRSTSGRSPT